MVINFSDTIVDISRLCEEISNHSLCEEFKITTSHFVVILRVGITVENKKGLCINKAFNVHNQKSSLEYLLGALNDLLVVAEVA